MVTWHAGLAVRAGGEVTALFAHAAVHTRAVAITLARCNTNRERLRMNASVGAHNFHCFNFLQLPFSRTDRKQVNMTFQILTH